MRNACVGRNLSLRCRPWLAIALAAVGMGGCASVLPMEREPLLRKPQMSSGAVVLDVFLARVPLGDPKLNDAIWREIDEQGLPADCRRRLLTNGFRVGVLAGQLPDALAEAISLAGAKRLPGEVHTLRSDKLAQWAPVVRGHFQVHPGARKEFPLGPVRDELPAPLGDAPGQTYRDAQPLVSVRPRLLADGRVRLEMAPEIAYGEWGRRYNMDEQGMYHVGGGRSSRVLDDLAFDVVLSPGHAVVMTMTPSRPWSLGWHFFSEPPTDQTLLLVRLSQTQHDGVFADDTAQMGE